MAQGDIKVVQENADGKYDEIVLQEGDDVLTNPMTAAGDIIYGGTSGAPTRLAKGTDGQVLKLASGVPVWDDESGGEGGGIESVVEDTTPQLGGDLDCQEHDLDNVGNIIHDEATASDFVIENADQDKDIIFKGNDGGSATEILKIDVSEGQLSGMLKAVAGVLTPATAETDYATGKSVVGINDQTGTTYTLVAGDAGKLVRCNNESAITLTVPKNSSVAFAVNTVITVEQKGAGQVTVAPVDGDVTINSYDGLKTAGQYAAVSLIKVDTNVWCCYGGIA